MNCINTLKGVTEIIMVNVSLKKDYNYIKRIQIKNGLYTNRCVMKIGHTDINFLQKSFIVYQHRSKKKEL